MVMGMLIRCLMMMMMILMVRLMIVMKEMLMSMSMMMVMMILLRPVVSMSTIPSIHPSLCTSEHTARVLALLARLPAPEKLLAAVVVGVEEGLEVGAVQVGATEDDALRHLISR